MTEYVVLRYEESHWALLTQAKARSARAAINYHMTEVLEGEEKSDPPPGVYVAVPARSWQPMTVKVETKTALRFS